jgi:hypothetical protein
MFFAGFMHQTQVYKMVGVIAENVRLPISSLEDMMRPTGYNETWKSHGKVLGD